MDPEEAYGKVFGLQAWDPETVSFYIGWNKSKAEELRTPPSCEEFESTAEESEASPPKGELD